MTDNLLQRAVTPLTLETMKQATSVTAYYLADTDDCFVVVELAWGTVCRRMSIIGIADIVALGDFATHASVIREMQPDRRGNEFGKRYVQDNPWPDMPHLIGYHYDRADEAISDEPPFFDM